MNIKRAFLVLGAMLIASAPVHAALNITTYTDRALFNAAVSDQHVETFDAQSVGDFCSRSFPGFAVSHFQCSGVHESRIDTYFGSKQWRYHSHYDDRFMRITFDQPTQALGFDWRNPDSNTDAEMTLEVGHQSFTFGGVDNGFFGVVIHDGGAVPSVRFRSKVPVGGGSDILHYLYLDNLAFATSDSALFRVTKDFTPDSTQTVDVKLTCDTGHDREQEATIAGEDPEGVVFVLTDIPLQGADCTVTEEGNSLSGYSTTYFPNPCTWSNVQGGDPMYTCNIDNTALPVTYGFTKVWNTDGDGGLNVVRESNVGIQCTTIIAGSTGGTYYADNYNRKWVSKSSTVSTDFWVKTVAWGATPVCWAWEDAQDSAIEVTKSGACGRTTINIGGSVRTCTITNTVFFEGIPTLSQYGLAIMALLMLGVGFIGFRRFV